MASIECHGGHPIMNLIEGNVVSELMCDDYWGGSRDNTFLRNWSQRDSLGQDTIIQYRLVAGARGRLELIREFRRQCAGYAGPDL